MKRFAKIALATTLTTTLAVPVVQVSAATQSEMDEVTRLLYEHTESPELWLDFIEANTDDSTGAWLPELILKLTNTSNQTTNTNTDTIKQETAIMEVTYKSVIEGYDHGPGISKVILKPSVAINPRTLSTDTFEVSTVSTYPDLDFTTFTYAEEATEHVGEREVTSAYLSDEKGNRDSDGEYITLELYVAPNVTASSPFNYNFLSGKNEYIPYYFNISLSDDATLLTSDGKDVELIPASVSENLGDYKLIADDFVNNQEYSQDGIDLLYASYKPETASTEEGSNPLIIWLHGAGEGGTDTTISILGNKVVNLATEDVQQYYGDTGAYILAPQSPTMWMDQGDGQYTSSGESKYTEALFGLIDSYVQANPEIDTDRIYIGGCSNGGYMTVNMIIEYPEYFAAAYPVCEAYSTAWLTDEKFEKIKDMPIWLTHALTDATIAVVEGEVDASYNLRPTVDENGNYTYIDEVSNNLYRRLVEAGNDNVYYSLYDDVVDTSGQYFNADGTPYEYMGHWSWIYTLNNECVEVIDGVETTIFDWLSQQSK